jgi:membrane-associated PAP2 superfamily phosphatase
MKPAPHYAHMRDLSPNRRLGLITWITLMCLLAWDFSGLDLGLMNAIADSNGFPLRDNWWFETVLHTRAKQLAIVVYLALLVMVWWPQKALRQLTRWQRSEIMVGITLSLITISTLKSFSLTSCPWELQAFGGQAVHVSHWWWGLPDGGSGRCFPGGHVSSAFAFLGLALPWLVSDSASQRTTGLRILLVVVLLGGVLGLTQTLRGAHFPSHTLWTGFICWAVVLANHFLFGWLAQRRPIHGSPEAKT